MSTRILKIGKRLTATLSRLRTHDPALVADIAKSTGMLATNAESLLDARAIIPPDATLYFVRRVRNRNAWLWYRVDGDFVIASRVTFSPPIPADEPTPPDPERSDDE